MVVPEQELVWRAHHCLLMAAVSFLLEPLFALVRAQVQVWLDSLGHWMLVVQPLFQW
jgi:hypothetical protein